MLNKPNFFSQGKTRKAQTLIVGGVIGAVFGVGTAYLLWQARERHRQATGEETPLLTGGDALKMGVLSFGLVRQIVELVQRNR
jgi:hypothetical protein